jgi:pyruvate/2-oxoglutarate dehydrogenase complex dihydrolipoamide dehydrogenase (E3) component
VQNFSIDFEKIVRRVNNITDTYSESIRSSYQSSDSPKLFSNECIFIGDKKISFVDTEKTVIMTANKILIASGTRPKIPEINGLKREWFYYKR